MALNSLHCAEVPLRNCSLTHSLTKRTSFIQQVSEQVNRKCPQEDNFQNYAPNLSAQKLRRVMIVRKSCIETKRRQKETSVLKL